MKSNIRIFLCTLIFVCTNVFSQETYKVLYEAKNIYPDDTNINSRALETFKRSRNVLTEFSLTFNSKESIFLRVDKVNNNQGSGFTIKPGTFINTYKNYEEKTYVNFMNNSITDNGSFVDLKWESTGESKKILDYEVHKFVYKEQDTFIVIWVSNDFKINTGPLNYNGFSGLILELEEKYKQNGYDMGVIYSAYNIEKIKELKKPKFLN